MAQTDNNISRQVDCINSYGRQTIWTSGKSCRHVDIECGWPPDCLDNHRDKIDRQTDTPDYLTDYLENQTKFAQSGKQFRQLDQLGEAVQMAIWQHV